jgi:hypothetical protein
MFDPQSEKFLVGPNYSRILATPERDRQRWKMKVKITSFTLIAVTSSNGVCLGSRGSIL